MVIRPEEEMQELREQSEEGRKYKIAIEVFSDFLDNRQNQIINEFGTKYCDEATVFDYLAELRVIKQFKNFSKTQVDLGEIAERELSKYGEQ